MKRTRTILRWLWIYFLHYSGLLGWVRRKIAASSGVVVITLHRVLPDPEFNSTLSPAGMVIRRKTFEQLLIFLKKNCILLPLVEGGPDWQGKSSRPRVAITFDDGWKDTAEIASPLLNKYDIPAAVFVCPGLAGSGLPFWPEQITRAWRSAAENKDVSGELALTCSSLLPEYTTFPINDEGSGLDKIIGTLKELPPEKRSALVRRLSVLTADSSCAPEASQLDATMTWQETTALEKCGIQIGSHTQHHEILTRLTLDHARREIADSKLAIESHLGRPCSMFAYPNGSWSLEVRELVSREGFQRAFVNSPGIWTSHTHPMAIPRVNIWEGSLIDLTNAFSSLAFQYTVFWRSYRAGSRERQSNMASVAQRELFRPPDWSMFR